MNAKAAVSEAKWTQLAPGEWEWQSEHYYYRAKRNNTTRKWALGRRIHPSFAIRLIGLYPTFKAAKQRAFAEAVSL